MILILMMLKLKSVMVILVKIGDESKMCTLTREEKRCIRKRDAKRIKLTGVCSLCGKEAITSRHHLWYNKEQFIRESVIEVCNQCDIKIHGRDENDNFVRNLKSVRAIELIRNEEFTERFDIFVDDQKVGCAYETINGIKLVIQDV